MRRTICIAKTITMSKSKKKSNRLQSPLSELHKSQSVQIDQQGNILIKILAKPGSKQNSIINISHEAIGIQISAPPVEGEANIEIIKYLSSVLGLRKSDVTLDKGTKARQKTILIPKGITTMDNVKFCLEKECGNRNK